VDRDSLRFWRGWWGWLRCRGCRCSGLKRVLRGVRDLREWEISFWGWSSCCWGACLLGYYCVMIFRRRDFILLFWVNRSLLLRNYLPIGLNLSQACSPKSICFVNYHRLSSSWPSEQLPFDFYRGCPWVFALIFMDRYLLHFLRLFLEATSQIIRCIWSFYRGGFWPVQERLFLSMHSLNFGLWLLLRDRS